MRGSSHKATFRTVIDVAVAVLFASTPFFDLSFDEWSDASGSPYTVFSASVFAVMIGIPLLLRRRYPVAILGLLLTAAMITAIPGEEAFPIPLLIAAAAALYTVASIRSRREAIGFGLVTAAISIAVEAWVESGTRVSLDSLTPLFWAACAVAAGDAVRSRRISMQMLEERAWRAEATREQEARTRVAEERLRIARELHDIVAHHIAVVNIQAGLAERAISRHAPETAATAISRVSEAARLALDDLSTVLTLLRASGDSDDREPVPGMAQVSELLDTYTSADNRVQVTLQGKSQPLDSASELTAYRVIQESLTNASKHGVFGQTRLILSYEPTHVVITVTNPVHGDTEATIPAAPGTGYGLIGLRERVVAIGGTVTAARHANGTFVVEAHIPYAPANPARTEVTP